MRVLVDHSVADAIVAELSRQDPRVGQDARAAVEWMTAADGDEFPAAFSRRELQTFLWYQLPRKWLIGPHEHRAVADALALFFDRVGPDAAPLAELCRSFKTRQLLRSGGKGLAAALDASGLEPPDTPTLTWSGYMSLEESLEHDQVAALLEEAIDDGRLTPGGKGWRQQQAELVEQHLTTPFGPSAETPLSRIRAARRAFWLHLHARTGNQPFLEAALDAVQTHPPSPANGAEALEPLLWLLSNLDNGLKLTQTGALPRALVRDAVVQYPDWWDTTTVGPPYQEAEILPLCTLHDLTRETKLARPHKNSLHLTPRGRALRADPTSLLTLIAETLASDLNAELDVELAQVTLNHDPDAINWPLHDLLGAFNGVTHTRRHATPTITPAGRTIAAAILDARAHGPKTSLQ